MSFKLSCPIPQDVVLSYSGGVDSAFGYDFLKNGGKRNVTLLHFNHGTRMANAYEYHTRMFALTEGVKLIVHRVSGSNEKEWRDQRYSIMNSMSEAVITCHHLDDNIETLLMRKRDIPAVNGNAIRPFLGVKKKAIYDYANKRGLLWMEDPTNKIGFTKRNRVRNELLPLAQELGIKL